MVITNKEFMDSLVWKKDKQNSEAEFKGWLLEVYPSNDDFWWAQARLCRPVNGATCVLETRTLTNTEDEAKGVLLRLIEIVSEGLRKACPEIAEGAVE